MFFGHDVGTGTIYQDDNIEVTAVENTHFKLHQAGPAVGKYKSYSYRFDTSDRVVVCLPVILVRASNSRNSPKGPIRWFRRSTQSKTASSSLSITDNGRS